MAAITIVNQGSELARVADLLDRFGAEQHLAPEIVADMQIALDEVLNNITRYAYRDKDEHKIEICLQVIDNALEAVIEDGGVPFDPAQSPPPDLSTSLHERRVGGVGLHFARKLLDKVSYERVDERNRLTLRKRFKT